MMKDLTEENPQSLLWRFTIPMYFCSYIMLATFSDLILRVVLSFVFASFLGVIGVWLSWPFGWSVGSVLSLWCNRNVTKRLENTFARKE